MTRPHTHRPIRTCVGCRCKADQVELVRVAVCGGRLAVDPGRRLVGRGAYIHASEHCFARAGRGLSKAFRRTVEPKDVLSLYESLASTRLRLAEDCTSR